MTSRVSNIPLVRREVMPFHVSADFITAGQNGATFSDQSAVLTSWHHTPQPTKKKTDMIRLRQHTNCQPGGSPLGETDLDALEASEKTCTHLERQRLGDAHIVWGWAPVRKVVRIANPLEEVQFIRFQRGFRWLQVPMAPCHDDYCPSRSRHACQLTNKLIKESGSRYTSSRKTRKFTRKGM